MNHCGNYASFLVAPYGLKRRVRLALGASYYPVYFLTHDMITEARETAENGEIVVAMINRGQDSWRDLRGDSETQYH